MTTTTTTATSKQIAYALSLLDDNGFSTRFMDKSFSKLGATMRERSGRVEGWLSGMSRSDISRLITTLGG